MASLYCPRCGDPIVEDDGEVGCRRGQMLLSPRMVADLTACFVERTRRPSDTPLALRVGGEWFCPGCAQPLVESTAGDLKCERCALSLNEFVHRLIELHPHERTSRANGGLRLSKDEAVRIASGWVDYQRHSWAYDSVESLVRDDPDGALTTLDELVATAPEELLSLVGAGPLEDFVRAYAAAFIEELEARAARDARWRDALGAVWIPDADDPVTLRLERLGCTQLRNRKHLP